MVYLKEKAAKTSASFISTVWLYVRIQLLLKQFHTENAKSV